MPEYFPGITNITNTSSTLSLADFAVSVDQNIFGGGGVIGLAILFTIFAVFFFALLIKGYPKSASFAVGCWMVTLSSFLLRGMSLLPDLYWYGAILLTPLSIVVLWIATSAEY